ncbi:hypothetical protein QQS21_001949 [Conoideocrella luteorostrata]|uniref:Phosphoglycerate mutase n=1 Tax=Conoideocrella luteorostrata TaxID=1105319 RepID=A0AAJ0G1M9_9HYPO|nr:hypothetical protein QQS21_001949 [Conoideocrella luteorostrata]
MHLLLIRHAESVDNVAGVYGGSRDAALTAHGVLQTQRLASSLVELKFEAKHVFSSNLQRAAMTATAVCEAQNQAHHASAPELRFTQLSELREKDFGNWEGVKFAPGPVDRRPVQSGAETSQSMMTRANVFLERHLLPVLSDNVDVNSEHACVVVVSHGIMLGLLTKALVKKLHSPSPDPSLIQLASAGTSWSNTGYLDMVIKELPEQTMSAVASTITPWSRFHSEVSETNCTRHLKGLRKTRGGIGSAAYDAKQKTLEGFFNGRAKKRKADHAST